MTICVGYVGVRIAICHAEEHEQFSRTTTGLLGISNNQIGLRDVMQGSGWLRPPVIEKRT